MIKANEEYSPSKSPVKIKFWRQQLNWISILVFLAVFTVPIVYGLITQHAWEDFFITFRHSKNLAEGKGLVFTEGERVHGFTSAINVLIPAAFYYISGKKSYLPALWGYVITGTMLMAVSVVLLFRYLYRQESWHRGWIFFWIFYMVFEVKIIVFSANGQEAAFITAFLALSLLGCLRGIDKHWLLTGIAWAGLMYTRPDSPVAITAIALSSLIFLRHIDFKSSLSGIMKAGLVCTLIYLPWFIFTWVYYGSPVPHTVIAKGTINAIPLNAVVLFIKTWKHIPYAILHIFSPIASIEFGGWPPWLLYFSFITGIFVTFYWALPLPDQTGRMFSFIIFLYIIYLAFAGYRSGGVMYNWYFVGPAFPGTVVLASGIVQIYKKWNNKASRFLLVPFAICTLFALIFLQIFLMQLYQLRIQQQVCEFGVRKPIGLWLRGHAVKDDTVYLECLGYIGYYSNCKMLDFPGLASPEVVKIRKERKLSFFGIITVLKPDWIVLRPRGAEIAFKKYPQLKESYQLAKVFDGKKRYENMPKVPAIFSHNRQPAGFPYIVIDSCFLLFRRIKTANSVLKIQ